MMSDTTRDQIAQLRIGGRPLVICDVDEVVVHFTRELEDHFEGVGLYLSPVSFALNGNVRRKDDHSPVETPEVMAHIDQVFRERTLHMQPIDGAIEALLHFGQRADVVMLTNLPHEAGDKRRLNLAGLGLPYPVVTNSGAKGPAIRALADMAQGPVVFIDDSPQFIASAYEYAPHVHLVHFLHDERFARHVEPFDYVSLHTDSWDEIGPHVLKLLG